VDGKVTEGRQPGRILMSLPSRRECMTMQGWEKLLTDVPRYQKAYGHRDHQIALNAHKLMEVWDFLG
jgi:hypothetical protein